MQAAAVGASIAYPLLRIARAIPFPVLMVGRRGKVGRCTEAETIFARAHQFVFRNLFQLNWNILGGNRNHCPNSRSARYSSSRTVQRRQSYEVVGERPRRRLGCAEAEQYCSPGNSYSEKPSWNSPAKLKSAPSIRERRGESGSSLGKRRSNLRMIKIAHITLFISSNLTLSPDLSNKPRIKMSQHFAVERQRDVCAILLGGHVGH
jgi:hypothetical protein